jgi:hypothetical protein
MLIIYLQMGVGWCAYVANTQIHYVFAGQGAQQVQNVKAFAESLQEDNASVYEYFDSEGVAPGVMEQQMFGDTTQFAFGDYFELDFGESLFDNLVEIGECMLEFI